MLEDPCQRSPTTLSHAFPRSPTRSRSSVQVRRRYVQNNVTFENPMADYGDYNALSEDMCQAQKSNFSETYRYSPAGDHRSNYNSTGRLQGVGEALKKGGPRASLPGPTAQPHRPALLFTPSAPCAQRYERYDSLLFSRRRLRQQHVATRQRVAQDGPVGRPQQAMGPNARPM